MIEIDRDRVLAYRYAVQQLDRSAAAIDELAVLPLGVPDSPAGSAVQSVRTRMPGAEIPDALALAWSVRGSAHLHRVADLPRLADQLYPLSDADVLARMPIMKSVGAPLAVFGKTVTAMREYSLEPTDRGSLSAAVTREVPEASAWCRACESTHVFYSLYLQAGLAAGIRLVRESGRLRITAAPNWHVPHQTARLDELIRDCLRVLGPSSIADLAAFLGTNANVLRPVWSTDLVEISVDGKRSWFAPEATTALSSPPTPRGVRLLPTGDPYLQARDRTQLLPDPTHRKALWRAVASPGALLVDGEIVGTWRAKKAGHQLQVDVTAFRTLRSTTRAEVAVEAEQLATTRGAKSAAVGFDSI
ncbi:winged helix DNA-binding domain-containing protein [Saccharopolyspora sp. K220]|uniref:DNA glycosylase AlkZ-like family protein n=1 Tax=Saccharopolyspora soli TaxID=2926618 RepID=UPI001F5A3ADF|nr:crosslink repair DNA glycosylase YcaQ family protein [Saccharopolyspora soli]MCI2419877.1 winged helix DNA-binding domain-containing protein [Saccharopolyspora soli]